VFVSEKLMGELVEELDHTQHCAAKFISGGMFCQGEIFVGLFLSNAQNLAISDLRSQI